MDYFRDVFSGGRAVLPGPQRLHGVQEYLAQKKPRLLNRPPPTGLPSGPRHSPTVYVGSQFCGLLTSDTDGSPST